MMDPSWYAASLSSSVPSSWPAMHGCYRRLLTTSVRPDEDAQPDYISRLATSQRVIQRCLTRPPMSSSNALPSGNEHFSYWYYVPNEGASIAFAILFAGSGLLHFSQCARFHSWKATGFLPWAAILFVVGFILRAIGAFHDENLPLFISSTVMLFAAPPVYEAANFFTLSRILYYVPYQAPIPPGRVVRTFAGLQVIVEALNVSGAARVVNSGLTAQQQNIGKALLKTALILQLACMVCFVALAGTFEYRCRKANLLPTKLRDVLRVLYVSCFLITTRTIYRTIEWFQDSGINYSEPSTFPPIFKQEWFFYVFEATLMILNTWMLNIFHPSHFLPSNLNMHLALDGMTEIEGHGFEDKRNILMTSIDPFDIWGLVIWGGKKHGLFEQQGRNEVSTENAVETGTRIELDSNVNSTATTAAAPV